MKLLFIDDSIDTMGGVERIINTLSNNFCKNNDVFIISKVKTRETPFFKYNENVKINYLIDESKDYAKRSNSKNIIYYISRIKEKIKEKKLYTYINDELLSIIKDSDYIVFGRITVAIDFLPFFKEKNIKNNIIVRDAIHLAYHDKRTLEMIKIFFPNMIKTLIVSSSESKNAYLDFFGDVPFDIKIIYNPLGIKPIIKYDFDSKTIVSLGRLDAQKGFENLIYAFNIVHSKHHDWKLNIYGDGKHKTRIEKIIKSCGLGKSVNILKSSKDVVNILNNSSIFVMSSRYEGYGNMLVEALACGVPSISYDWLMGTNEIIKNNVNGIIVPLKNRLDYMKGNIYKEDIQNLAEAINKLIENRELCEDFSKKSADIINSRNVDIIINEWNNLFK